MQVKKLLAAAVLGTGLWLVPGAVLADTTVQNQNSCENCYAQSGGSYSSNNANVQSGPQAGSGFGSAQAQQNGSNSTQVNQKSSSKSGHAVAGSQVTGASGGGNTTIQNQNNAKNVAAVSGPAVAFNNANVQSGPQAGSLFGPAQASQNGSNFTLVDLQTSSESGNAIAGSQITGVIG